MKYFVLSDIHSFAKEMQAALKQAGFDYKNKDHTLIVCGDIFDRGPDAIKVYKFLKRIPKARCILIKGNHESLYFELLNKKFPEGHDFSNMTVDTFCQIADMTDICDGISMAEYLESGYTYSYGYIADREYIDPDCQLNWGLIKNKVANSEVTKWLKSTQWRDYYELDKFIFVHSFIPTTLKQSVIDQFGINAYGFENPECFEYNQEWRKLTTGQWEPARWGCPFSQYRTGLFKPEENSGKVLVCGHWHTSDFYKHLKHINCYRHECAPIYYSTGLIGLDGGCMYNSITEEFIHPQNVMIIDEDLNCFDKYNRQLFEEPEFRNRIIRTVTLDKDGNPLPSMDDFIEN